MSDTQEAHDDQARLWNGPSGRAWVEAQEVLDGMFRPFEELLVQAADAGAGEQVLDVGCGTGALTLAIARRAGQGGRCVGIDISAPMIAAARVRAAREGLPVSFVCADAQTCDVEPGRFDRIVSRFGVMFFGDPARAFANLRRAARSGARLHFAAWRAPAENPFMTAAERAAAPLLPKLPARGKGGPGQFAFADGERVRSILEASGWREIDIRPIDVACMLPEADLGRYLARLGPVGLALRHEDDPTRERVMRAVRGAFEAYVQGAEVRFTAACWMASARAD